MKKLKFPKILCLSLLAFTFFLQNSLAFANSMIKDISLENIKKHMEYQVNTIGIRVAGSPEEKACGDYIYKELENYGYSSSNNTLAYKPFSLTVPKVLDSANIIATVSGNSEKDIVAIVSHYDSMSKTVGARDNAGGIAALLEIARLTHGKEFPFELRLVALGSEENGFWGATRYIESLSEEEKIRHKAVYNMDISIGTIDRGNVLTVTTLGKRSPDGYIEGNPFEPADNAVSQSIIEAYIKLGYATLEDKGTLYVAPHYFGESDHVSFHKAGIDAGNVCMRKPEGDYAELPLEYHTMEDNMENLDYNSLKIVMECILTVLENNF